MSDLSGSDDGQPELRWQDWLKPGDRLLCSHMTAEPLGLLASLADAASLPDALQIELGVPFSLQAGQLDSDVSLRTLGGMGSSARLARQRPVTIDRSGYREAVNAYATGRRQADIVLVSLACAGDGTLHLGASHGAALDAARRARLVIAEINRAAPVLHGAPWPRDIALTIRLPVDYAIATARTRPAGEVETRIAQHLADLVPNRACLQVGIGSLPAAVLDALAGHRGLGIHTGMLSDALYELVRSGAADNGHKPDGLRNAVVGSVYGSATLYERANDNPGIRLAHPEVTHGLLTLASIPGFTAINSAIEVDLLGRVNAESAASTNGGRRYVGGVGGLRDLVNGAAASRGGRSIIALPARTDAGEEGRARIVSRLQHEITLDETLSDTVVTEHGVAELRGRTVSQRQAAMLAIAAPEDRDRLRHELARTDV